MTRTLILLRPLTNLNIEVMGVSFKEKVDLAAGLCGIILILVAVMSATIFWGILGG